MRVRWIGVARLAAVGLAALLGVLSLPGLLKPADPPPPAGDVGLTGLAAPAPRPAPHPEAIARVGPARALTSAADGPKSSAGLDISAHRPSVPVEPAPESPPESPAPPAPTPAPAPSPSGDGSVEFAPR